MYIAHMFSLYPRRIHLKKTTLYTAYFKYIHFFSFVYYIVFCVFFLSVGIFLVSKHYVPIGWLRKRRQRDMCCVCVCVCVCGWLRWRVDAWLRVRIYIYGFDEIPSGAEVTRSATQGADGGA